MKAKLTRDNYRPSSELGYVEFKPTSVELPNGMEIYVNFSRCAAMLFSGKRTKPDWHYRYQNLDLMYKAVLDAIEVVITRDARIDTNKKAKAAWVHDVIVGDVFRCTWGYDQTNIDYYEVTKLVGKTMCEVRELAQDIFKTDDMQGTCVPVPGKFAVEADYSKERVNGCYPMKDKKSRRFRIRCSYQNTPAIAVYKFADAYRIAPQEVAPGVKVFSADRWTSYA